MPATPVYVWPQSLLDGIWADLQGGRKSGNRPVIVHTYVEGENERQVYATIFLDAECGHVPAGRVTFSVRGATCATVEAADRSAVVAVIDALRAQHQVVLVDFNYKYLIDKRQNYTAMKAALYSLRSSWLEMEMILKDCRAGIDKLCDALSVWVGEPHGNIDPDQVVAVAAFETSMKLQCGEVRADIMHIAVLADMIMLRDVVPQQQGVLDATTPIPMEIDMEKSMYLLTSIYKEAITKFRGVVSPTKYVAMPDGQLKAHIEITTEPYTLWGASAATKKGARANLYYVVIKHVNEHLGHPVIDLHYTVRQYQDLFSERFDHKMRGIWRLAYRLKELMDKSYATFGCSLCELNSRFPLGIDADEVFGPINAFSASIRGLKGQMDFVWQRVGPLLGEDGAPEVVDGL